LSARSTSALLALAFVAAACPAGATPRHAHRAPPAVIVCNERGCSDRATPSEPPAAPPRAHRRRTQLDANGNAVILGGRPPGCPHEFCGCEASIYLFGHMRRELNLASNWIKHFPRSAAAPGMAAVRNHHVMVLMRHVDGDEWLVHDGNSGHGLTREHVRSIRGYVIVDPQATRELVATASKRTQRARAVRTVTTGGPGGSEANAAY
jgi:hypothetical protein